MIKLGNTVESNSPVHVDIERILEGRLLLQANSGGGKSYALRKLLEITHGKVQQIILDPEGEFATLREKYDYILIGENGDLPVNVRASQLLARKILELGSSAIIDLYELKHQERKHFVKTFLDSLVNAPKNLWHPCLVIVDEAHKFAPEKGHGEAESLESVIDLATTGRKRGYALVCATQRLSKLNKDVVAELNTKLIGRSSLDVDMKRAGFELGFTTKQDLFQLRDLEKGQFFAFGPALTSKVTKIKVGLCETTHPKAGKISKKSTIATSAKIKSVLSKLEDLPQKADEELKTLDDYKRKVFELTKAVKAQKVNPVLDEKRAKQLWQNGYDAAERTFKTAIKKYEIQKSHLEKQIKNIHQISSSTVNLISNSKETIEKEKYVPIEKFMKNETKVDFQISQSGQSKTIEINNNSTLRPGAMKILQAAAMFYPDSTTIQRVGTISAFTVKGGSFKTYLSVLKKAGFITLSGQEITCTEEGRKEAGNFLTLPTDPDQLLEMWCGKLRPGAAKIFRVVHAAYPNSITTYEVGEKINQSADGGSFKTYVSIIKRNGLIEKIGDNLTASKELFE